MTRTQICKHIEYYLDNGEPYHIVAFARALTQAVELLRADKNAMMGAKMREGKNKDKSS